MGEQERISPQSLLQIELFETLSEDEAGKVALLTETTKYLPEDKIFEQDVPGTCLCILMEGSVRVERNGKVIGVITPGQTIGEMSILDGRKRSASCICTSYVTAVLLNRADYLRIAKEWPETALKIVTQMARIMSKRLRISQNM